MATRLTFLCAGATAMSRAGGFPYPAAPLDAGGARQAAALRLPLDRWDRVVSSASQSAIETVAALGCTAEVDAAVADIDPGDWAGRTFQEIEAVAPDALMAWLADPERATPGGEALAAVRARVGRWMDHAIETSGAALVVSHAMVMRAAIAHALAIPLGAALRFDIAPLATLELSYNRRWRLQELRRP